MITVYVALRERVTVEGLLVTTVSSLCLEISTFLLSFKLSSSLCVNFISSSEKLFHPSTYTQC
ncbi:hypothetical protein J6590_091107 [Homalodisca vitripennis]|nr:hypothetical protein J6590_091107 [Homalodisca vitripennis]